MFGFMKSFKSAPPSPGDQSDAETDNKATNQAEKQTAFKANTSKAAKNRYQNDFKDDGGLENQSTEELEQYAVHKAEETTSTVNNCLKIAEDIKGEATQTLETLHQQGDQIHRTHEMAVTIDHDLSKGEKLLGSLGGMFSKTWKPKKTREIKGPQITPEPSSKAAKKEDKQKLMATDLEQKGKHSHKTTAASEPASCYEKIEMEKAKQDDALDDLSNILGDLKGMAVDMGSELERQNHALDHLGDDIDELNSRVKGANERARKLVAK